MAKMEAKQIIEVVWPAKKSGAWKGGDKKQH